MLNVAQPRQVVNLATLCHAPGTRTHRLLKVLYKKIQVKASQAPNIAS